MFFKLYIKNKDNLYIPEIVDEITLKTEKQGSPGTMEFSVIEDELLKIEEGNLVVLQVDDVDIFWGYIGSISRTKESVIEIKASDQLKYLKNKDTYVYENKTASEFIKMIAEDFKINLGEIDDTGFKIKSRVEENTTLFDMILNALDLTLQNKKEMYVLFDDCGKLTLKNISKMESDVLLDIDTTCDFEFKTSIEDETYNKIKLTYNNQKTGKRDVYIAQDSNNIDNWGILQMYETLQDGENGKAKADALLELYNTKKRSLSVTALGDISIRAGSLIPVKLKFKDLEINNFMLVEKCTHKFNSQQHIMELNLKGGEINNA